MKKELPLNDFNPKMKAPKTKTPFTGQVARTLIYMITAIVGVVLLLLVGFVIMKSTVLFKETSFFDFIFKSGWNPSGTNPTYNIGSIILMTLMLLLVSMVFAIPLTIFSTLFISEYLSKKQQKTVMTIVKLLAGIPSVVFGLFAREQVGALFKLMGAPTNDNLMVAGLTMAFMAVPTMVSLSYNAVQQVPDGYRFGSLALGISKEKTTFSIVRKSAWTKIISAIIMGMSRVIGETMAIMMIAGNTTGGFNTSNGISGFLFSSIRTLSGTIGLDMLENKGAVHQSALYAIGLVLFILVFIINLTILVISNFDNWKRQQRAKTEQKRVEGGITRKQGKKYNDYQLIAIVNNRADNKLFKHIYSYSMLFFMWMSTALVISFTFWILGTVAFKGLAGLQYADAFMSIEGNGQAGIFAALLTTLLLIFATMMFAIPLALGTALYLSEYSIKGSKVTKVLRFSIGLLASTPSIVFGIFGLSIFVIFLRIPLSILAASLTMTIVILPMLITNFEDAITQVPDSYREAGAALGMSKIKRVIKIIIPNAMEGIITGVILAMARIVGESAPIYLTTSTAVGMPTQGFLSTGTTLTTEIYMLAAEGGPGRAEAVAYLMSLITILLVFTLNFASGRISGLVLGVKQSSIAFKLRETITKYKEFNLSQSWISGWTKTKHNFKFIYKEFKPSAIVKKTGFWFVRRKEYKRLKKGGVQ